MKKLSANLLIIISFLFTTTNANANMFNKFRKGFYFEKYKTAEEAKAALLELHPIGSDVEELLRTLSRAGAKCGIYETKIETYTDTFQGKEFSGKRPVTRKREKIYESNNNYYGCFYKVNGLSTGFICAIDWSVQIKVKPENQASIFSIEVNTDKYCL